MDNKVSAIIEARMSSKRLKGKVLKKINNKEILKLIIERIQKSKNLEKIIVATSKDKRDDKIINLLKKMKISYYRGSSSNVMDRVIKCAEKYKIRNILRVTADNPLTDYLLIDHMISFFNKNKSYDYVTNNYFANTDNRKLAYGLDLSLFSLKSLKKVKKFTKNNSKFLEHPTLYYYTKGKLKFKIKNVVQPSKLTIKEKFRLTIDTPQDFDFFKSLFTEYYKKHKKSNYIKIQDIRKILLKKKFLLKINKDINQYVPKISS
jgi:spore coat polysaccharide biosynthesis protein SpsF